MMDLAMQPDKANRVLDIPYSYHKIVTQRLVSMGVDMIWLGDDMGGQNAMLMSPRMWRQYFKPRMADLIASLRLINPHIKIAYHTDGVVYPIIPDLIEIGLDILNPIQPMAMDPVRLKNEYGKNLCFWGSLDIQQTLPFGTPGQVKAEVLTRLQDHRTGRRAVDRPHAQFTARYPARKFLGDGRDHPSNVLIKIA